MYLTGEAFRTVIGATPLVSIDLVLRNESGQVLLGLRTNRPAQGFWFVPGGRVFKGETLDAAFMRLTSEELGKQMTRARARPLGIYEHFYTDSVFGESPATHYVVLAYQLSLNLVLEELPTAQHRNYRWWDTVDMATSENVHLHSRTYVDALETGLS
ncbi:MAG: GDP-mannose mannosyl hydrolase [Ectothiorhodospiraceae bacterium]|nr:GDP-mannose mannosyl hydrolase [Ectothiorhodospiraceae bacterium]MCH8506239.1 GDP-mannose mannosyl hydrolase [Ectothiorhodospiraceae bacterium]